MSDQITISAYDVYAHAYDQGVVDFWRDFPRDFLKKFAGELRGKRVLNLGSGSGRDAVLLRELGLEVVCVDASASMIAITQALGFESHLARFSDIDFAPQSFDGVWAYCSLLHVQRQHAAEVLRNLRAIIRPQGLCVVGVIEGQNEARYEHEIMPDTSRYFQYYDSAQLKLLLAEASFSFVHEQQYAADGGLFLSHIYRPA